MVRNSDNILTQYLDMPSCIAVWNHKAEINAAEPSAEEDDLPEAEYKGNPNDEDVFTEDPKESKGYKHITLEMTSHDQVLEKAKVPNSLVALASQLVCCFGIKRSDWSDESSRPNSPIFRKDDLLII